MSFRSWRGLLATLCCVTLPAVGVAQADKKVVPEFTKQVLLIVNFNPAPGTDPKLARRSADAVRSRVEKVVNKREIDVVEGSDIADRLFRADFDSDAPVTATNVRALVNWFRVDQYLQADVATTSTGTRMSGVLVLVRDERLRQRLPAVTAARPDSAAALFAKVVATALSQLIPQRRCETALHEGSTARALAAARGAISAYPGAMLARTCLLWTLRGSNAPAREILSVAQEILASDSTNFHALEGAAVALDSLKRRDEAASMYLRLAGTDTADLDLAARVGNSLINGGNGKRAEPYVIGLCAAHPDDMRFMQQKWRVTYENQSWEHAIEAGEVLLARDSIARHDSTFFLHLGQVYRAANRPYKAIETLAHGAAEFPKDVRLYSAYTQAIKSEADTVLPRGLLLFPESADLLALTGKELRARGKLAESLDLTRRAIAIDSTMAQGRLVVAQLELELGRPDSALSTLRRAVTAGEDSTLVAQFVLSKGNAFYRAAAASKRMDDFAMAYRFLAFADSVRSTVQSKFLVGVSALGIAQAAFAESAKTKDKPESCRLLRSGADLLPAARRGLETGLESFGDMAKQSLDYLTQLEPWAATQLTTACAGVPE